MVLLKSLTNDTGTSEVLIFMCPGCSRTHPYTVRHPDPKFPTWEFNGNFERPTFTPSLMCNRGGPQQCHLYVKDGWIEYQGDCWHDLAGQRIPMVELPENWL